MHTTIWSMLTASLLHLRVAKNTQVQFVIKNALVRMSFNIAECNQRASGVVRALAPKFPIKFYGLIAYFVPFPGICMWTGVCSMSACAPAIRPNRWSIPGNFHRSTYLDYLATTQTNMELYCAQCTAFCVRDIVMWARIELTLIQFLPKCFLFDDPRAESMDWFPAMNAVIHPQQNVSKTEIESNGQVTLLNFASIRFCQIRLIPFVPNPICGTKDSLRPLQVSFIIS